jgi:tripartite-type tricarboxylate transporter receptor subunit TctC
MRAFTSLAASLTLALCATPLAAHAQTQSVADFYRGKSIRLIVGAAAGGGYDIPARLLSTYMPKHIPGNPSIVVENMPGATSLIMTNYLYSRAPRDGTAIGMPNNNLPLEPRLKLLSREGGNVAFDISKFGWIGSPAQEPQVLYTLTSAARSVADLKTNKVIVGSTGTSADNYTLPYMLNQILGAKIEMVTGYKGQSDIFLAIEQGEVQGNSTGLSNLLVSKANWLRDDKVRILVQFGDQRATEIPDVPTAVELAPDQASREMIRLMALKFRMARPIAAPPEVPADRLKALQDAFDATMKDEAFLAEARKIGLDISPVGGAEITRLVAEIQTAPQALFDRLREVLAITGAK